MKSLPEAEELQPAQNLPRKVISWIGTSESQTLQKPKLIEKHFLDMKNIFILIKKILQYFSKNKIICLIEKTFQSLPRENLT